MDESQRVHQLYKSFREIHQAFTQALLKAAAPHGITPVQLLVLKVVSDSPHIRLSDLAERIQLGASTTSGIVDRMVKAELLVRERTDADRRSVALSLTERGVQIWHVVHESRLEKLRPLLELSHEEQDALLRIHGKIVHNLQNMREEGDHD